MVKNLVQKARWKNISRKATQKLTENMTSVVRFAKINLWTIVKKIHTDTTQYKCEECGKIFVSEWRLQKHRNIHDKTAKINCCHYFNNKEECPFEEIGCIFRHEQAKDCKFGKNCSIRLCQFKHNEQNDALESQENEADEQLEEFEKDEIREEICGKNCWQGDHKCFDIEKEN